MKQLLLGMFLLSLAVSLRPQTALAQPSILEYSMSPNKGVQSQFIVDTIAFPIQIATDCGFPFSVYLQNGNSVIFGTVVNVSAYPDTFAMSFNIPEGADTGSYDLVMIGGISCEGDTEVDSNVFTVESAYTTVPSVAIQGHTVTTTSTSTLPLDPGCYPSDIYLEKDTTKIIGSIVHVVFPDTIIATFQIPPAADTGLYSIVMLLTCDSECCNLDSIPNAFRIEEASSGVNDIAYHTLLNSLRVFPNPAQDHFEILFAMNAPSQVHLWLYDELGRTIATLSDGPLATGAQTFDWSCKDVPNGSYFYELTAGEEMYVGRIVVQH